MVTQITHIKEDLVEMLLVVILIYLAVVVRCLTVLTEKVVEAVASGISLVLHTIMLTTKKILLTVSGDLVEDMDIILRTVMHTTMVTVEQVVSSYSITLKRL